MSSSVPYDSENESRYSNDSSLTETTRPNRWLGHPSSWRDLTKTERSIAASLDVARDRDLSLHLFNAHALKRKAREIDEIEGERTDIPVLENTGGFVPPKTWTAWPLRPEDVPRAGDEDFLDDEFDAFTLRKRDQGGMSRDLEEALTAVALRMAKEKFRRRVFAESRGGNHSESGVERSDVHRETAEDVLDQDGAESHSSPDEPFVSAQEDLDMSSEGLQSYTKASRKASKISEKEYVPVISTDDDRSRTLLRPSMRHTLSKLDDVLLTLHHARATCLAITKPESEIEAGSRSVTSTPSRDLIVSDRRPIGRPRNNAYSPGAPSEPLESSQPKRRGRPKKEYPRLKGETEQEHVIRIARLQKKPIPSFAPAAPLPSRPSVPGSPRRPRSPPTHQSGLEDLIKSRNKKLELRDWSEVLGAAAIVGFDPKVIDRAARRCAAIFGESMSMRTIVEAPFDEPQDTLQMYHPDKIPDFDTDESSNEPDADSASEEDNEAAPVQGSTSQLPSENRQLKSFVCPLEDCPRHFKAFRDGYSMRRHLQLVHKVDEYEANQDDTVSLSDDEFDGAVHVDGFMKPMTFPLKAPVLGPRRRQRKPRAAFKSGMEVKAVEEEREEFVEESDEEVDGEVGQSKESSVGSGDDTSSTSEDESS